MTVRRDHPGPLPLLVLLFLAVGAAGCGYRLVGGGFLEPHIRTIALKPFENRTDRPEIEQRVTEAIARQLAKRGRYRVVTDQTGADALLEGAVTDYRSDPVQFTSEGRATRLEAVVTIQARMIDLTRDEVIWNQSGLLFREQYDVPAGGVFIELETVALDEIAEGAAGALVTAILEGF